MNENEKLPCSNCWNVDGDKDDCIDHCLRLNAYQRNKPWYHIPPYGMEQKEEVTIPAPIKEKPKNTYVVAKVCPTCRIEVGNRRGLCTKCYDKWRKGGLIHPIEGEWFPNRKTRPKKADKDFKIFCKKHFDEMEERGGPQLPKAKKTRKHGISDEALRNVEPNLDAAVKRIDARYNPQELHTVKEILDETAARIITIDLVKYDVLYNKLQAAAKSQLMPIEHTIISLISCGMQVVERNTKQSFGGELPPAKTGERFDNAFKAQNKRTGIA